MGEMPTEAEVTERVAAAAAQDNKSPFNGVSWDKRRRKWTARIGHDGKTVELGQFDDEKEAAEAFDAKARELRGTPQAHGGRSGSNWWRLNFPTAAEEQYAQQQGMPAKKV
jgi:hypothetical protein